MQAFALIASGQQKLHQGVNHIYIYGYCIYIYMDTVYMEIYMCGLVGSVLYLPSLLSYWSPKKSPGVFVEKRALEI